MKDLYICLNLINNNTFMQKAMAIGAQMYAKIYNPILKHVLRDVWWNK